MSRAGDSGAAEMALLEQSVPDAAPAAILRQMIAVLENERQALAVLDAEGLTEAARVKEGLCSALVPLCPDALDPETRGLAETARRLNEVNRRVRNLLAANVAARLGALSGAEREGAATYDPHAGAGGATGLVPLRPQPTR